jgi:response regulator RpfG family c-di-GMP phosphodiesterase
VPVSNEVIHNEQLRIRERLHNLESLTAAHTHLLAAYETSMTKIAESVEKMETSAEIAAAVAERLEQRRSFTLTRMQKVAGIAAVAIATIVPLLTFFGFGHG